MNLRERRKVETADVIRRAALELARTIEVDAISIEAICGKAGISQRTFFNYFPFKEAVFVVPPPPFPAEAVEAFVAGQGALLGDLAELLAAQALAFSPDHSMMDLSRRIAERHPKVAALQFASFHEFEAALSTLIARRNGTDGPGVEYRVIAAATLGALRVVLDENAQGSRQHLATAIVRDLQQLSAFARAPEKSRSERLSK